MTNYINCDKPKKAFGRIECNNCGTKYDFEFDPIQAPYKETGFLRCHSCGVDLVKWNSTAEPYLVRVTE